MHNEKLIIRLMRLSDLDGVIYIHLEQFPASRSTKLGKPFLKKMYSWFITNQPDLALVAENEGHVVGFLVGAIGGYGRKIFRSALPQIALGILADPKLIFKKETFSMWQSFLKGLLPKVFQTSQTSHSASNQVRVNAALSSIAVDRTYQGKGTGKALIQIFEQHAKESGANSVSLTVEKDNQAAIRLYKNCGWNADLDNEHSVHFSKILDPQMNLPNENQ